MFRVCTYNVHSFYDGLSRPSFDRIVEVIDEIKPDVLCLQEVHGFGLNKLRSALNFEFSISWAGCAILSNHPMEEVNTSERGGARGRGYHPRFLTGRVSFNHQNKTFLITCCHLDHRDERKRLSEMRKITEQLQHVDYNKESHIWAGDFNSLSKEDYTNEVWEEIANVRKLNLWESPKTQVISN